MIITHTWTNKPLTDQNYFNDFNWDYEWKKGDIIWTEDYCKRDFKHSAGTFEKVEGEQVFICPIAEYITQKISDKNYTNINEVYNV